MISLKSWCWVSGALALTSLAFILFALIFWQEKTEKPVLKCSPKTGQGDKVQNGLP